MKKGCLTIVILLSITSVWFFASTAFSATDTFYAQADTMVAGHYSTTNYGGSAEISSGAENYYGTIYYSNVLVRFDLSSVPDAAVITGARLIMNTNFNYPSYNVGVYHVANDAWNESTVTWITRPAVDPNQSGVLAVTGVRVYSMTFDLFQYQLNKWNYQTDLNDNLASFMLTYYSGGSLGWLDYDIVHYDTKEASGGLTGGPRLELDYVTSVPLPSSMFLFAPALAGLAAGRRRFKK